MDNLTLLYHKRGYFEIHGWDVICTILIFVISIGVSSYSTYTGIVANIQNNWNEHRCNPIYMPFAGVIMPQPGQSTMDTTVQNFSYCIKQDTSMVFNIVMMPLEFSMYMVIEFLDTVMESIVASMNILKWIQNQIGEISKELYDKILKFVIPVIETTIHLRDSLAKANGAILVMLYTTMNIYNIAVSGVINVMNLLNNMLIGVISVMLALVAAAIVLIPTPLFPAGLAMYASGMVLMATIIIPTLVIFVLMEVFTNEILHETAPKPPKTPNIKKK